VKSWNTQNNLLKALLLALLFGTSSCSGEKSQPEAQATPQVPVEDESTRLKRAIAETDLASSPEMVAFNCRKLQKLLIGKALEEETQARCAEAMLLMAKRASIRSGPERRRADIDRWCLAGLADCGSEGNRGARCGKTARRDLCGGRLTAFLPRHAAYIVERV
jgi:hypothetical protein